MVKKTLTALVLAAGIAFPNISRGIPVGPDLLPVTDEPAAGKIERKGREMIEKGVDYSPRFDCLVELAPYTTYTLEIGPTDTYSDIISFFRERGVTYDHLEELKNNLRERTNFSSGNQIVEPYLWGTNISATHFECPARVPWIPTEIKGVVTSAALRGDQLELTLTTDKPLTRYPSDSTLNSYDFNLKITLPRALRITTGESVRIYREKGLDGDTITDFDKLEIIGEDEKVKFTYHN